MGIIFIVKFCCHKELGINAGIPTESPPKGKKGLEREKNKLKNLGKYKNYSGGLKSCMLKL